MKVTWIIFFLAMATTVYAQRGGPGTIKQETQKLVKVSQQIKNTANEFNRAHRVKAAANDLFYSTKHFGKIVKNKKKKRAKAKIQELKGELYQLEKQVELLQNHRSGRHTSGSIDKLKHKIQRYKNVLKKVAKLIKKKKPGGGHGGKGWFSVVGVDCQQFCQGLGLWNGTSKEGAQCASGENPIKSAQGKVSYSYGCWPSCSPKYTSNAKSEGGYCYEWGQKKDFDRTDKTVGCFCI